MKLFSRFLLGLLALFALAAPVPAQVVSTQAVPVLTAPNPCVIPSLSLNFAANGGSGVYCLSGRQYTSVSALPGWTFSRTGQGYAERSDGTLVLFGSGVPRITDKGLLVEEPRTNLLLWSQDLTNAIFAKNAGATANSAAATAPDGTVTATRLNGGNAGFAAFSQTVTATSGTAYTYALYAKAGTASQVALRLDTTYDSAFSGVIFDCSNGTFVAYTDGSTPSYTITALANGWYRFTVTVTLASGVQNNARAYIVKGGSLSTAVASTDNIYVWQADLQSGSFITSAIPTTSASATRGADVVTFSGSALASLTGADGYALTAFTTSVGGANRIFSLNEHALHGLTAGNAIFFSRDSSAHTAQTANAYTVGSIAKAGVSWDATGVSAVLNGGTVATAGYTADTFASGQLGNNATGNRALNGYFRSFAVYPGRPADSTLQALTQ